MIKRISAVLFCFLTQMAFRLNSQQCTSCQWTTAQYEYTVHVGEYCYEQALQEKYYYCGIYEYSTIYYFEYTCNDDGY